ncbi:heterokaryon incompatibility protein-domain-containing protein [Podospora fimiseda]|uniref:Heterokaryon incompatibility protein-domain-containing protein n=1 Tax=Podospora fimiseda TaxID=252190 RepID=A0AAN7GRJ9_9PEZI|nr:heterokaryon incompatibility protein-domain-containing protein [Podospora fimiseda]
MMDQYSQSQTAAFLPDLNQRLVPVSDQNKNNLLGSSHYARHHQEHRARAASTLCQLHKLNPLVAGYFKLKPNTLSDLSLRMILPADHDPSQQVSSFIVVSYCWHYPEWFNSPHSNAPGWEITQPMMEAVWNVRNNPAEGVWLDKLCINQENDTDKTTHIATMDTIYHSARRMVILLEDVNLDQAEEIAGLAYSKFYADMSREVHKRGLQGQEKRVFVDDYFPRREQEYRDSGKEGNLNGAKSLATKILAARWFSRAWCAHESRIHPHKRVDNPLLMCFSPSGKVISFEFRFIFYLAMVLSRLLEPSNMPMGDAYTLYVNDPNPKTIEQLWWRILSLVPDHTFGVSPLQHLVSVASLACLKKGDLISIALNTAGIPLFFDGNEHVNTVEDVKWMFSLLVLASGDLIPLVAPGKRLRVPDASKENGGFVSWATDTAHGPLDDRLENPLPGSITAITAEYIELDLLVFSCQPKKATEESLALADRIIGEHDLLTLKANFLSLAPQDIQHQAGLVSDTMDRRKRSVHPTWKAPHEICLRLILALSLDAGLEFILSFPESLAHSTADYMRGVIDGRSSSPAAPQIHSAASFILSHFSAPDSHLPTLTRFISILLNPRLQFLTLSPRLLSLPPILGSFCFTPSFSNRSYLAVPACLAHLPAWYQYGWVIEPFDPSEPVEDPEFHLPPRQSELSGEEKTIEDIAPVLNTDFADRREPIRETGEWRLRTKQILFGMERVWDKNVINRVLSGKEDLDGVKVLKRQRVYRGEEYDWGEIRKRLAVLKFGEGDDVEKMAQKMEGLSVRAGIQGPSG